MPKYWPVVRAALSAGLYPNLVRVDYGKKKFKVGGEPNVFHRRRHQCTLFCCLRTNGDPVYLSNAARFVNCILRACCTHGQLLSADHITLNPHPSSVTAEGNLFVRRWAYYHEMCRTPGGLFIYDLTEASPLALLLFGAGNTNVEGRSPSARVGLGHRRFAGCIPG